MVQSSYDQFNVVQYGTIHHGTVQCGRVCQGTVGCLHGLVVLTWMVEGWRRTGAEEKEEERSHGLT